VKVLESVTHRASSICFTKHVARSGRAVSRETKNDRLRIVPAGRAGEARLSDFTGDDLEAALQAAAMDADLVVIQAPPCDRVSDAVALARSVDEVCLVLSAKSITYRAASAACEMLSRVGAKKISLVLTDASPQDEPSRRERCIRRPKREPSRPRF